MGTLLMATAMFANPPPALQHVGRLNEYVSRVVVVDDHLLVMAGYQHHVFSLVDPTAPKRLGKVTGPQPSLTRMKDASARNS